MDGFDMRNLEVGRVYVVDDAHGRYLVKSGYAEPHTHAERANDTKRKKNKR